MITALKEEISQFVQSAGFKRYFKNTSWMLGGKLLQLIATFWVTAKVAKYLGPDQFGLWGYAQSVGVLFIVLAGMGLKQIVSRNLVNHPE
ncbi:MAG: oligosaccharide flippase family protein, partial [Bacteroidetes bacterium]|nr:oligosaccharide flippase family protein [Bacteroidota bacterium]